MKLIHNILLAFAIVFLHVFIITESSSAQTLSFNQVILVSSTPQTVPSGKVWKVENVFVGLVQKLVANSGTGGGCGGASCNGSTTNWTSFTIQDCPDLNAEPLLRVNTQEIRYLEGSPLWLPAGTVVQGNQYNCASGNGWYTGQGYNCYCPTTPSVWSSVSVIEFNVVP